jgi:hypothetical protein
MLLGYMQAVGWFVGTEPQENAGSMGFLCENTSQAGVEGGGGPGVNVYVHP